MVIDGLSLPSSLNRGKLSILANGLFGLGSFGVPSTLLHDPTEVFMPMTVYRTSACSPTLELDRIIDSLTLAPAPTVTFSPMLTFGPN